MKKSGFRAERLTAAQIRNGGITEEQLEETESKSFAQQIVLLLLGVGTLVWIWFVTVLAAKCMYYLTAWTWDLI